MNDRHHGHIHPAGGSLHTEHDDRATVRDPVCGMMVDPERTAHHAEHGGRTFHFCSARCHDKFVAAPSRT
ncbi:YHS domain-containing protein [Azospirillum sp. INR13]|nr:YHS domain-containing protein [Azospirillum sp. INR13]